MCKTFFDVHIVFSISNVKLKLANVTNVSSQITTLSFVAAFSLVFCFCKHQDKNSHSVPTRLQLELHKLVEPDNRSACTNLCVFSVLM